MGCVRADAWVKRAARDAPAASAVLPVAVVPPTVCIAIASVLQSRSCGARRAAPRVRRACARLLLQRADHVALRAFHLPSRIAIVDVCALNGGACASAFNPNSTRSSRLLRTKHSYVAIVAANAAPLMTTNFTATPAFHSTTIVPMVAIAT